MRVNVVGHFEDISYYPFGMQMPGRQYELPNSEYRYGFNGKELDVDMDGNNYDYGFRIYNPALGRFLSVDPITKNYPMLTPYQFASNRPIDGIDLDGLEYATFTIFVQNGKVKDISVVKDYELKNPHTLGAGIQLKYTYLDKAGKIEKSETKPLVTNMYGIYQGDKNPRLPKIGENPNVLYDDYSLAPINEQDAIALKHDKAYDDLRPKQAGFKGVMDNSTTPSNKEAIKAADDIINRFLKHDKDKITGKEITSEESGAAIQMKAGFTAAEDIKSAHETAKKTASAVGSFFKSIAKTYQKIKDITVSGLNSINNIRP